ncbi:androgen-dependent TFPI-regulating protein-like isoform X1 [Leptopilina heterotoma]|uniref:androgen-dependent TFPI-regulating protein-like isoform X1 n=1 Tax=Leptopilina heterotoma TaxID=63436 RepID=UPI001CA97778|nr:androgen-dependent TFPI-regulating protein-like isoform X1 [Leptopilina heterotoma]XP_043475175.1 androgen-dependent TFPI-regulating protein-like isoform X1 [Leptopilina heterotoma]XP_043475176.1 androgen-dependent TFPI-regulating protein-like isoform X1 [Leptopilina heterotoma]
MSSTTYCLIHMAMSGIYVFTAYYAFFHLDIPMLRRSTEYFDPGQFKYLTVWNVILQAIFFFICMLNDVYGTNKSSPKKTPFIRRFKDFFHAALSFPVGMFVGVTFWSLMFVDRELVLPKALDPYFPSWLNHLMHTLIVVTTVTEMFIAPRQYPKRTQGLGGLLSFMLTYLVWMHVIYMKSGIWVYPVMEVLTVPLRIAFIVVLLLFTVILYFTGETFNHLIWGNTRKTLTKVGKKKKSK